ncbi:MAG: serine/threonine protein kinase [Planctomycetota bacterium]|nr:serine/threonine protein kinase [Planctomycetota bacterium]
MNFDQTQSQSDHDQNRARELSERPTRPPLEVPGYETRQFLGSGAYGEVWVAIDKNTGRRVAIKFLTHRTAMDWALLSGEVEKLIFLSADRYVVQLLDVGWEAEPPYYVMEYVESGSLEQLLERTPKSLSVEGAVQLFREIVIGVAHAHRKGILHCDLKPANILLDHDRRPRLADFGQSRLSHDQRPSLGTLFYMAPEQADMHAIPDAGWDIYALGAVLYRMLTGTPPFRDDKTLSDLDSSSDLADRLSRYRKLIEQAVRPRAHRLVHGVDRILADIVDRCLERNPELRYRDAQDILDAIDERERNHHRRPLVILGIVGPLLLLSILSLFAWRGYDRAIRNTEQAIATTTQGSNQLTAKFAAEVVSYRISHRFLGVEDVASRPEVLATFAKIQHDANIGKLVEQLKRTNIPDGERESYRNQFLQNDVRKEFDRLLESYMSDSTLPEASSWFVTDRDGLQIATAFGTRPGQSVVGGNFSWRSYFNGIKDYADDERKPILQKTHLSDVFKSQATNTWKIAISTPIRDPLSQESVGLIALSVELGAFTDFVKTKDQFAAIVDSREGEHYGQILQHPLFNQILETEAKLPLDIFDYRVPLADMLSRPQQIYTDPLGEHPLGQEFRRKWIASLEPVRLTGDRDSRKDPSAADESQSTGLVVLVQDDYDAATTPVRRLHGELLPLGLWALLATTVATCLLWLFVYRSMRANRAKSLVQAAHDNPALHNLETIELPAPLR